MTTFDTSSIHRYLDSVFGGIPASADAQDLKEEIRSNLMARVAELEATGLTGAAAATKAIKELGDISEVLAPLGEATAPGDPSARTAVREGAAAAHARNKVRPKPAFVIRTVVWSLVAAVGVAMAALAATGLVSLAAWAQAVNAVAVVALPVGMLTADGCLQETTSNYPLPRRRSISYGIAAALGAAGLALGGIYLGDHSVPWPILVCVPLAVASVLAFTYLGVTQTNRKKPWVRALGEQWMSDHNGQWGPDGFTEDPVAAARFGIYSSALWIVALGGFVAASIASGFRWSWLALFGALVIQMLLLGRMLFPSARVPRGDR